MKHIMMKKITIMELSVKITEDLNVFNDVTLTINSEVDQDIIEPAHEISNNMVCATSKASDQPAHTRSLIRAFASRLSIL